MDSCLPDSIQHHNWKADNCPHPWVADPKLSYILNTDVSTLGLGAAFYRKQQGLKRVVTCKLQSVKMWNKTTLLSTQWLSPPRTNTQWQWRIWRRHRNKSRFHKHVFDSTLKESTEFWLEMSALIIRKLAARWESDVYVKHRQTGDLPVYVMKRNYLLYIIYLLYRENIINIV